MQIPCVYIPGPAPAVTVANISISQENEPIYHGLLRSTFPLLPRPHVGTWGIYQETWVEFFGSNFIF
jgi:hypothetical protein